MKKIVFICLLCPVLALAQKEIKPSVNKAESALQKGALDEAKAIIDATVASQEYMVDKKGNPSKNANKAWYLRGLIYTGIDTTKVEKFKSLEADPFTVAKQSFEKCNCQYASYNLVMGMTKEDVKKYFGEPNKMVTPDQWIYNGNTVSFKDNKLSNYQEGKDKLPIEPKNESLVNRLYMGLQVPMTNIEVAKFVAQAYLTRSYDNYKKKDYKKAFADAEKILLFIPNDTSQLMNAGVYFGPQAEENDKAIAYINQYLNAGGKNPDALLQLYAIYAKRKDFDNALAAAHKLTALYPNNIDYLNNEYNIYVQTNRMPEAKAAMLKRAQATPNDTESRYFLALICKKMGQDAEAMQWIKDILKIDSENYDANEEMAATLSREARSLNEQRNASKDQKKRLELFNQRHEKLKEAVPFAEKCAAVKPSDENALFGLLSLYENLSTYDEAYDKKATDLKKKMKALGIQVD